MQVPNSILVYFPLVYHFIQVDGMIWVRWNERKEDLSLDFNTPLEWVSFILFLESVLVGWIILLDRYMMIRHGLAIPQFKALTPHRRHKGLRVLICGMDNESFTFLGLVDVMDPVVNSRWNRVLATMRGVNGLKIWKFESKANQWGPGWQYWYRLHEPQVFDSIHR